MCFQRSSERIEGKSRPPQSGWKIVPQSRTGCRETPIAKERSNGLMLNPRPYLVCNNSASASTVNRCDIPIVVVPITSARSVLDLGIYTLMRAHVNQTVSWCFAALRRLRLQIRRAVPTATFQILVVALVHSLLDYCNAVLVGITTYLVRRLLSVLNAAAPATARPHHRCIDDTALAARPRTCAVQGRGANVQSFARQRATISGTSCRRLWPTWSASSAVSKYQPPGHTAHQTVYCWQLCLSGCRSSSLERSARGRHLIVITAVFPASTKDSSFSTIDWISDCLLGIVTVVLVVTLLFKPLIIYVYLLTYLLTYLPMCFLYDGAKTFKLCIYVWNVSTWSKFANYQCTAQIYNRVF